MVVFHPTQMAHRGSRRPSARRRAVLGRSADALAVRRGGGALAATQCARVACCNFAGRATITVVLSPFESFRGSGCGGARVGVAARGHQTRNRRAWSVDGPGRRPGLAIRISHAMHTANVAVKLLVAVLSLLSVGTGLPVANSSRRLSERSPQMQGLGQAKAVEAVSAPAPAAAAAATGLAPAATLPIGLATPAPAMLPSTAVPVVQGVPAVGMPAAVPAPSSPAAVPAEEAVAAVGLIRPVLAPMPAEPAAVGQVGQALSQHMPAAKRAAVAQLSAGLAAEPVVPAGQQPTAVSSLPMGTYTQSCQACVFDNHVLRCARCEDGKRGCRNGDFSGCADGAHEVQVDLTGCSSEVVENNHGRLRCSSSSAASRGMGGPVAGGGGHRMGSDLTYSQNYQDTWVVRLAASNGWVGQGYFLDLGAFNGVYCSNSKLLEDILGWDGAFERPIPALAWQTLPSVSWLRVGAIFSNCIIGYSGACVATDRGSCDRCLCGAFPHPLVRRRAV